MSALEPRQLPQDTIWKGGVLLGVLDASRDNWVMRHQWVEGGATAAAEAAAAAIAAGDGAPAAAAGGAGEGARGGTPAPANRTGGGASSQKSGPSGGGVQPSIREGAIGTRHAKLFYYVKAQQGL